MSDRARYVRIEDLLDRVSVHVDAGQLAALDAAGLGEVERAAEALFRAQEAGADGPTIRARLAELHAALYYGPAR